MAAWLPGGHQNWCLGIPNITLCLAEVIVKHRLNARQGAGLPFLSFSADSHLFSNAVLKKENSDGWLSLYLVCHSLSSSVCRTHFKISTHRPSGFALSFEICWLPAEASTLNYADGCIERHITMRNRIPILFLRAKTPLQVDSFKQDRHLITSHVEPALKSLEMSLLTVEHSGHSPLSMLPNLMLMTLAS